MATVYLIPCVLADNASETIPTYVMDAVKKCSVFFAENIRTARRFLKMTDSTLVIDDYEWFEIHKAEQEQIQAFAECIKQKKIIGIISEAGCPGVADPGQILIAVAQKMNCSVIPLVGPSSLLLALMASGMNGQQFEFAGYLPIDSGDRVRKIKELETASQKHNSTKIFIETPFRNNSLAEAIVKTCNDNTMLCIAVNLTSAEEYIKTKPIIDWKKSLPELHKKPSIFLLYAGK